MRKDGPFPLDQENAGAGKLVYTIDKVAVKRAAMNKVIIVINADGRTRTNGWKNPQLIPVKYVQAPPNGVWDFQFVAEPPGGVSNEVITPIHADYEWNNPPGDVKGVRIVAETNQKTASV